MSSINEYEAEKRRIIVVTNVDGEIIASAGVARARSRHGPGDDEWTSGIGVLPGQSVHVIDSPPGFSELAAVEKHRWLGCHRLAFEPEARLVRRPGTSEGSHEHDYCAN